MNCKVYVELHQNNNKGNTSIPHIPISCPILTFHCHYNLKSFRHTQFNTDTYIDKSLRNTYYSGVSTPCPRLIIVSKAESHINRSAKQSSVGTLLLFDKFIYRIQSITAYLHSDSNRCY